MFHVYVTTITIKYEHANKNKRKWTYQNWQKIVFFFIKIYVVLTEKFDENSN